MSIQKWVRSAALAAAAALVFATPSSAADVTSVSGSAFGLQATGGATVTAGPSVTLPPTGGTSSASALTGSVPGFLTTGALSVSTNGTIGASGFATSFADVANVNLLVGLLTADAVHSTCTSNATGSTGSTMLTNAVLNGVPLGGSPAPNTDVSIAGVATIILNQQNPVGGTGALDITVNAIRVTTLLGEDIIIAQSHCDVTTSASAVELQAFAARRVDTGVVLRWSTASELQTVGFNVYRQKGDSLVKLNAKLIAARGESGLGAGYAYVDRKAPRSGPARYRLQAVQLNGARVWLGRTSLAR